MQESRIKEELSISYMNAVSAYAGISFNLQRHDEESTDAILEKRIELEGARWYNVSLRVQLKSISSKKQYQDHGDVIKYPLKAKNYNDLCLDATTPIILCLLVLPDDSEEWIKWTREELLLKGVMYWAGFQGQAASDNTASVTVEINKRNAVNSETLRDLMEAVAREECL